MEKWLPVVGWEWGYEVSNYGRVRSINRVVEQKCRWGGTQIRRIPGKIMRQHSSKQKHCYGRMSVGLGGGDMAPSRQKTRLVHQLVLEAFVGQRPDGLECRHIDGNPTNNNLGNLEYGTPKENSIDKVRHGTVIRGEKSKASKLTDADVLEIRNLVGYVLYDDIAARFGISIAQVSRIKNRHRWAHL